MRTRQHPGLRDTLLSILTVFVSAALALPALALNAAAPATPAAAQSAPLGTAQLEQLVAPIALYPDDLMSQMLMASTYPLEVVEAARWSRSNPNVTGFALQGAMAKQRWDPSVKALTAVPQSLQMMNDKIEWTQQLGDAFLGRQSDLLAAVQTLRARADAAGNLKSTPQLTVTKAVQPGPSGAPQPVITLAPTDSRVTYVPIYDPGTVYGAWPYPDSAPFAWYPPGTVTGGMLAFGAGLATGAALWGGVDWWRGNVIVDPNRFNAFNRTHIASNIWKHDPGRRGAAPYRDRVVAANRLGASSTAAARDAARNRAALNKSSARPRQADRPRAAAPAPTRQAGANRPMGTRPAGLNRPAGGMHRAGEARGGMRRR